MFFISMGQSHLIQGLTGYGDHLFLAAPVLQLVKETLVSLLVFKCIIDPGL